MMISEETCGSCEYRNSEGAGKICCMNENATEYLEEVRWNHTCILWEMEHDEEAMPDVP